MIYSEAFFLGWICTVQIVQHVMTAGYDLDDLNRDRFKVQY